MDATGRIGRYHVLGPIARGGMAEVLRVKSVGLAGFEKVQALKRIARQQAGDPRFIRSFIDEARIAAQLNHKNIVTVFDFGEVDGDLYLTMELVDGVDLRTALGLAQARGAWPPLPLACHVIAEIATGLDHAHRKTDGDGRGLGIVHCDVSPANVMVSREGEVKILDFGIARATFAQAVERRRLRGKPRYMAPEQARGGEPTTATDVFALAVVAWELLTGQALFDGGDVATILTAVRSRPIPPIDQVRPEVPAAVARVLERALTRDPRVRPPALEVARACAVGAAGATARTVAAWWRDAIGDHPPARAPLAEATRDTADRVPQPSEIAPTTRLRAGAGTLVDAEPTAPEAGVPWLDLVPVGTVDGDEVADTTVDQAVPDAIHPPPTTRSPS